MLQANHIRAKRRSDQQIRCVHQKAKPPARIQSISIAIYKTGILQHQKAMQAYRPMHSRIAQFLSRERQSGRLALTACLIAGQIIGLVRTAIVARMLGAEIKGDAAILGLIAGFFGCLFSLNAAWQLVQSDEYDDPQLQSSLHGTNLLRGCGMSFLLAASSIGVLEIFDRPDLLGPMLFLSIVPCIDALVHIDTWRYLRSNRYGPLAIVELAAPVTAMIAAAVLLATTRSVWVVAASNVAAVLGRTITSHAVASRPYQIRIFKKYLMPIVRYSLPLIPGGLCFWLNSQSDQAVMIASQRLPAIEQFDLTMIGAYSTVAMLATTPQSTIVKLMQPTVTTYIANAKHDSETLGNAMRFLILRQFQLSIIIAVIGGPFSVLAFGLILGQSYSSGITVSPILFGALSIRLLRILSYTSSAAIGSTTIIPFGNCVRLVGLPLAITFAWLHAGIIGLAASVLVAEPLAASACGLWLNRMICGVGRPVILASVAIAFLTFIAFLISQPFLT